MSSLSSSKEELLSLCEDFIRRGRPRQATKIIRGLSVKNLSRTKKVELAKFCRRLGLIHEGLRILSPIIKRNRKKFYSEEASPGEFCEYAALLQRGGMTVEALRILTQFDEQENPEILLYQSYCKFMHWQYLDAVPLLKRYLEICQSDYSRAIASVNLAACYVYLGQTEKSIGLLMTTINHCQNQFYHKLLGNCFELLAHHYLECGDHAQAEVALNRAAEILEHDESIDSFFVKKWQVLLEATITKNTYLLESFRTEAIAKRAWESLREIDFYLLKMKFDKNLFKRLWYGSPHGQFRERLLGAFFDREVCKGFSLSNDCGGGYRLDQFSYSLEDCSVRPPKRVEELFYFLQKDLYRPQSQGAIYNYLYEDQMFDIYSSPLRIRQLIFRLRKWMCEAEIPANLVFSEGYYSLKFRPGTQFSIFYPSKSLSINQKIIEKMQISHWAEDGFKAKDLRSYGLQGTVAWRFIRWAEKNKYISRYGAGCNTFYLLAGETKIFL